MNMGKKRQRNISIKPDAARSKSEEKAGLKAQSLSSGEEVKKLKNRKFEERKGANQIPSSSSVKGSTNNADNMRKNSNSVSNQSSNAKILKEKLPIKRKNLDEVDSICSPPKISKVSTAVTEVKCYKASNRNGNKDHPSVGKRKSNSTEKPEFTILSDQTKKNSKQPKLYSKSKGNCNSRSDAADDKHCMPSNSSKKNKKDNVTHQEPKGSAIKNSNFGKMKIEKQTTHPPKKSLPEKKRMKKQSSKVSKKPDVENSLSAKRQAAKSASMNVLINAAPSTSKSMNTDVSDPLALLMMMEGNASSQAALENSTAPEVSMSDDTINGMNSSQDPSTDSEEELSDWEDVHDHPVPDTFNKSQLPDKPVEITMDLPDILKKKKKKKKAFDWKAYFEQRMRRFKKEVAANMHKTHLLCLIAHGIRQNTILNEPTLSAMLLSIVPRKFDLKAGTSEEKQIESLMSWYRQTFPLTQITFASQLSLISAGSMMRAVSTKSISDARLWVFVFICLLRALDFKVRLVLSFQPMPFKPDQIANLKTPSGKGKQPAKGNGKPRGKVKKDQVSETNKNKQNQKSSKSSSSALPSSSASKSKYFKSSSKISSPSTPLSSSSSSSSRTQSVRKSKEQAKLKSRQNLKDEENDVFADDDNDEMSDVEHKYAKKKPVKKMEKIKDNIESDSEFEESPSLCLKKDLKIRSNRKIISVSSEEEFDCSQGQPTVSKAHDFWMELYVKEKKKWMCFDCFKVQFGKPYALEQSATQPLSYVVGFGKDNSVKDVTPRYAKQWLSQTRKIRVDADWVNDTFSYFDLSSYKERIMEEDDIKCQLMVRPMPTSIGDFKNHPLYALKRHLLKFEAIYPNTAIPLGYIKTEPIYARECVRLLHSRDNWLKEGRFVRLKEEPYKMVKSRPKWNKPKDNPDELDLEIFGEWQTEKYIPPPAVNGKVPKNDYGNVELFQPWMLPKGTVHLKVQGLQRVAKKLGIDVAPAMIGWDYHSGYSHPVMDGWVVCEEFADTLLEAWDEDQENQRQREEEKRDKRVYGNWKRLIRGLLIKERLKNKFLEEKNLAMTSEVLKGEEDELHFSDAEPALPTEQFWPQNRQEEEKAELKEKMQEYKSQLKKEREKRKEEIMKDADDLKEEPSDKLQNKKSSFQNKSNSLNNNLNSKNKNFCRVTESKRKSIAVESSESSSEEEGKNSVSKAQLMRKDNKKLKSKQTTVRKPMKKKMSDDEEEDETYVPIGSGRKRHEEETSDKKDYPNKTGRQTRSRLRCL